MRTPAADRWATVQDLEQGIERFLLNGERSLQQLCEQAQRHGVEWATTIRQVKALREAGRVEILPGPGLNYKLSDWNRVQMEGERLGNGMRL